MHSVKISPQLTVAAQPDLEDFADIAAQGFTTLINNRPDHEEPAQPGSEAEAAAAKAAGLDYAHIPITGPSITQADIRALQTVLAGARGPVFAHCKSGTRTANLWALGEVLDGRMTPQDCQDFGARTGFDLRTAQGWLARNGRV